MRNTILGLALAAVTAINLGFYERVAKNGSYIFICIGAGVYYLVIAATLFFTRSDLGGEVKSFFYDADNTRNFIFYILTMSMSYVFFIITKEKNVELSSVYDILYLPILLLLSIGHEHKRIDLEFLFACILIVIGVFILGRK